MTEQAAFLRSSAKAFDSGQEMEAKRMALTLRVLLHDTGMSKSLLSQYGSGFNWRFADSAEPFNPRNLMGHHGLVAIKMSNTPPTPTASFVPRCESIRALYPFVPFRLWWSNAVVFKDARAELFTRKDIVLTMADQDGGGHVDPELDAAYSGLAKENSMGWKLHVGDQEVPWPNNPVPASVRQIVHEVLVTLEAAEIIPREDEAG
jgi:hypothetical protein